MMSENKTTTTTTTTDPIGKIKPVPETGEAVDLDLRKMYLAGTISIPPSLPAKASLTVKLQGPINQQYFMVTATQEVSQRVSVSRTFFGHDVKAVFIPTPGKICDLRCGEWIIGPKEIWDHFDQHQNSGFEGVIFVPENAQSLLETKAGLTASESAEYYPPMPQDRSNNQYNLKRVGCGQDECCDFPPDDNSGGNCCVCGGGCSCGGGSGNGGGGCCCCC